MAKKLTVTSLRDLKEYSRGQIVELPPFAEGQSFVARLKRPSMIGLARQGKIPNVLLQKANELFVSSGGALNPYDTNMFDELGSILDVIAQETFVEPTYDELKESGIELTDAQLMFVFNYSQRGLDALGNFRTNEEDRNNSDNE